MRVYIGLSQFQVFVREPITNVLAVQGQIYVTVLISLGAICQGTNHKRLSCPGQLYVTVLISLGANMPSEFAAINAFVREQKQANALARSRRDSLDPRRISMSTCNYLTDKNKNGNPV